MPWVRFDDSAPDDPKLDHLSDGAFRLWFNAICFSNRNLTDGFVPIARVPRLTPRYKPSHMTELLNAGAWHKQEDGITIHGYLEYQPSSQQVQQQREYERERKARQRASGRRSVDIDPTTGQFMSRQLSRRDTDRDSQRDSGLVSPATQPNPTQPNLLTSSSSEPWNAASSEEEDPCITEAKRRLRATTTTVVDPDAWVRTAARRLQAEGWTPAPQRPPASCRTCNDLPLADPCPDCTRSATA